MPESIYNPRIIDEDMYFVGTDPEDAVNRWRVFEDCEEAEEWAESYQDPEAGAFSVFKMKVSINLTSAKKEYTAGDFDRAVGRID